MINAQVELIQLQQVVPLDISGLKAEFNRYYLELDGVDTEQQTPFESIVRLSNARKHLNFARMFIRNLIDPSHNEYVLNCKIEYEHMNGNIGRSDKRIDALEKDLQEIKNSLDKSQTNSFFVVDYQRILEEQMNYFVIHVIKEAYREFSENDFFNSKNQPIEKNKKFFIYLMFRQLYLSSETLGSYTREERATAFKKGIIPEKAPSPIPKDADTVETEESEPDSEIDSEIEEMIESEPGEEDELESL